jgi:hypothetical protein
MTEDEFRRGKAAEPPQQVTPGRLPEPEPVRDVPTPPQHERLALDRPAPKRTRPVKPKVRKRLEPPRFSLPDWSKITWLFAVGLTVMVVFAFVAVIADPTLAKTWVEAMFGKIGGLVGG